MQDRSSATHSMAPQSTHFKAQLSFKVVILNLSYYIIIHCEIDSIVLLKVKYS